MKNKSLVLLVVVLAISAFVLVPAYAQGSWTTGIDVQNLTSTSGSVVVEFFQSDGTSAGTLSNSISGFGGLNFYLPNEASLASGEYSAVVSSDVQVAAATSLQNYDLGGADIYLGTDAPVNFLTFPLVYRNHTSGNWNSSLIVQNTSASAQTVTLNLYTAGESAPDVTKTQSIPGNASFTFDISDTEYAAFGPFGSATVEAVDPLAGVAMSIRNPGTGTTSVIETSYRAFGDSQKGLNVVTPLVYKNFNAWTTGINVVNTGTTETTVTVTYKNANPSITGGPWTDSITLAGNEMGVFYTPANATGLPNGFYGSAELSSDTNDIFVVVASQRNRTTGQEGVAYEGSLNDGAITSCVSLPVTHNRTSWKTGINILNLGLADATVEINYISSAAGIPDAVKTYTVPAGKPYTVYMPTDAATALGFYGGADVKSTNGQPLLVNVANSRADRGVASNFVGINYTCPAP